LKRFSLIVILYHGIANLIKLGTNVKNLSVRNIKRNVSTIHEEFASESDFNNLVHSTALSRKYPYRF